MGSVSGAVVSLVPAVEGALVNFQCSLNAGLCLLVARNCTDSSLVTNCVMLKVSYHLLIYNTIWVEGSVNFGITGFCILAAISYLDSGLMTHSVMLKVRQQANS